MGNPSINIDRQAVVIIHGIGDQTPTDTLRSFVKAIAPPIRNSRKPHYFSKPDAVSSSYELRRMTANEHRDSFKTDYYEFYWAHLMQGTTLSDVWWWVKKLFFRRPAYVPTRLQGIYWFLWLSIFLFLAIAMVSLFLSFSVDSRESLHRQWPKSYELLAGIKRFATEHSILVSTIISVLLVIPNYIFIEYIGDAARYTTPSPRNIAERQAIRKAGLSLLKKLHEIDATGKSRYDRIVLVGHSLGSMIAYDLLNLYWCEIHETTKSADVAVFERIEEASFRLKRAYERYTANSTDSAIRQAYEAELITFRKEQFSCWKAQHGHLVPWRISDLITVGSPLSHAQLLMAQNPEHLKEKISDREYPTCPPVTEANETFMVGTNTIPRFSFPDSQSSSPPRPRLLNHSAPFALTRWTNLYFKNDYVGGPIEGMLGVGVQDKCLRSENHGGIPFRSHTTYWNANETESTSYIRDTLQLRIPAAELRL